MYNKEHSSQLIYGMGGEEYTLIPSPIPLGRMEEQVTFSPPKTSHHIEEAKDQPPQDILEVGLLWPI